MSSKVAILIIAVLSFLCCQSNLLAADAVDARLQGIWFGEGRHPHSRTVLLVQDQRFVVITPQGAFVSKFTATQKPALSEIELQRYDGHRQLGMYEIEGTTLRLKLGEPNGTRPTSDDVTTADGEPHWHTTYQRRATPEGLEVLQKCLSSTALAERLAQPTVTHTSLKRPH